MSLARRRPARAGFVIATALALVLTGCQTTGGATQDASGTPTAELEERNSRFNETVATGAVVGAVLGGALGYFIGGDAKSAAIGAGAGGIGGGLVGREVALNNLNEAERQETLRQRIQIADQEVQEYRADVRKTREVVQRQNARIDRLKQQVRAGEVSQDQYEAEIGRVNNSIRVIEENIDNNAERIAGISADIQRFEENGVDASALEARKRDLENLRQQQQDLADDLRQQRRSLPDSAENTA
jgi:hypothetical protein